MHMPVAVHRVHYVHATYVKAMSSIVALGQADGVEDTTGLCNELTFCKDLMV